MSSDAEKSETGQNNFQSEMDVIRDSLASLADVQSSLDAKGFSIAAIHVEQALESLKRELALLEAKRNLA